MKDQWAGLFADFLIRQNGEATLNSLAQQMMSLESVASALKGYSEKLIEQLTPDISADVISKTNYKIKKDNDFAVFVRNDFIKHLVMSHDADEKSLFELFTIESDYSVFSKETRKLMSGRCHALESSRVVSQLQSLRNELGLPAFEVDEESIRPTRALRHRKRDIPES